MEQAAEASPEAEMAVSDTGLSAAVASAALEGAMVVVVAGQPDTGFASAGATAAVGAASASVADTAVAGTAAAAAE